jgi:hypothetical protein
MYTITKLQTRLLLSLWVFRHPEQIIMLKHDIEKEADYRITDTKGYPHKPRSAFSCQSMLVRYFNNYPIK